MKIALINEDSQAERNSLIYSVLSEVADKYGHNVANYGMFSEKDKHQINYIQVGVMASTILETGMADFIVTGCGTGQGAMISCNAFQNVICGYASSPLDAFVFSQINAGNAISIPYAQQFGWGSEVNLKMIFEQLFGQSFGGGYPTKYADEEKVSRVKMSTDIKSKAQKNTLDALNSMDQEMLKSLFDYDEFQKQFQLYAKENLVSDFIKKILQ